MSKEHEEPITVAIVDDDEMSRRGFVALLIDTGIQLIGACSTHEEFIDLITNQPPQVALIDMCFYGWKKTGGIDLLRTVKRLSPFTKCIILTGVDPDGNLFPEAYAAGAHGYLRKGYVSGVHLPDMIKIVASGQYIYDAELAQAILSWLESVDPAEPWQSKRDEIQLTKRQEEILRMVAAGHDNMEIAQELVISVTTVKTHIQNILEKLQVRNREQAGLYYAMKSSIRNYNS